MLWKKTPGKTYTRAEANLPRLMTLVASYSGTIAILHTLEIFFIYCNVMKLGPNGASGTTHG